MSTEERRDVDAVRRRIVALMMPARLDEFREEYADRLGLVRELEPEVVLVYPNIPIPDRVYGLKSY